MLPVGRFANIRGTCFYVFFESTGAVPCLTPIILTVPQPVIYTQMGGVGVGRAKGGEGDAHVHCTLNLSTL